MRPTRKGFALVALLFGLAAPVGAADPLDAAATEALRQQFGDSVGIAALSSVAEGACHEAEVTQAQPLGRPVEGRIAVLVGVRCAEGERQLPLWYRLEVERPVPVARHELRSGQLLSAADLEWVTRPTAYDEQVILLPTLDSADLRTTRPVRAGETLSPTHWRKAYSIESGQPVTALARVGTVALRLNTVAAGQGDAGALIRVRAPSRGYLTARVTGSGVVEVQP